MQNTKELDYLLSLYPCQEGVDYVKSMPSLYEAWEQCKNGQWMWWYLEKEKKATRIDSILFSRGCAMSVSHLSSYYNAAAAYAAYAAAAAYAAYAAAAAAHAAAYAHAAYAANADAAYAIKLWQANYIHSFIENPFKP